MCILDGINNYVDSILKKYEPLKVRNRKVIHDPIHGSNIFDPHEIAIIDSPFCQRLRFITQTDVAYQIYPSLNHNRFEHTLGVAVIVGKVIEALKLRCSNIMTKEVFLESRIASLLHDIGHGPFSHLSEDIIKDFPEIMEYRTNHPGMFDPDKPHEMLSYLIVTSQKFKDFFKEEIVKRYELPDINLDKIGEMIIGKMSNADLEGFKSDLINGVFDSDKLDYLQRDCYFSGLKMGIDLDRFLHSVWIQSKPGKPRHIKIMKGGVTTLEQILFNKVLLYSSVYHHQKIRAAECNIKGIFEMIKDNISRDEYKINGRSLDSAISFLIITDKDILNTDGKPIDLKNQIEKFLSRSLLKRALVISADTVVDPDKSPGYSELKALADKPNELKVLRKLLYESLNKKYSEYEIWIDLPVSPRLREPSQTIIQSEGENDEGIPLSDIFPLDKWLTTYSALKWKGHVFCPPHPDVRKEVGKKAAELLEDLYKIKLKPRAFDDAKID